MSNDNTVPAAMVDQADLMLGKKTLADVQPGGRVRLGTPCARWAATGEPDPHGTRYDCERSELAMGSLSDDELANAVFIHGDRNLTFAQMSSGELPGSAYLAAAKDRIRWLSRALAAAEALSAQPSPGGQGEVCIPLPTPGNGEWSDGWNACREAMLRGEGEALAARQPDTAHAAYHTGKAIGRREAELEAAARQPVGEPVAYLDLGAGGYMDVGTDLSDEELAALPKGRHMLGIIGTYGVDGYKPAQAVDLGQFRPFIVEARNNAYAFIETMRKAGRDSSDAREKAAITERLLDLIDSQAVGK